MKGLYHCTIILLGMFLLSMAVGCKPTVPSKYISPGELEDLLYDYHLADAMAQQAPGDYAENLVAYREAVMKKYDVTQAEFDSSMVYYMRHADVLHGIYENLANRLKGDADAMGATGAITLNTGSVSGDTVDIWQGEKTLALIPNAPYNYYNFEYKADSTIHKGDGFILAFHTDFIFQDGSRDGIAVLAVVFGNDSTASQVVHLSSPTDLSLMVEDRNNLGVKSVKGMFMLNKSMMANNSSTTLQLMSISRIHLLRCHRTATKPAPSTPASVSPADSPQVRRDTGRLMINKVPATDRPMSDEPARRFSSAQREQRPRQE